MPALLLTDPAMTRHDPGRGHPERPHRLVAVTEALADIADVHVDRRAPTPAATEALERAHDPEYVRKLLELRGRRLALDHDTIVSDDSIDAALLAAGCASDAVDAVISGTHHSAFAIGRPPGHHAGQRRAMGFCLFNNIAVAASHALHQHGLDRVMIVDWDVHHGNGTQDIFEETDRVLYVSSHQWPWYPGTGSIDETGTGAGRGFTVNLPLPPHIDDAAMLELYRRVISPIAAHYQPQLLLVSAGFDAHEDDPLGQMDLTAAGFAALTAWAMDVADRCDAPLALVLEGGYDLTSLAGGVRACVEQLCGMRESAPADGAVDPDHASLIDALAQRHRRNWSGIDA